jgi:predicted permease
MRNVKLALRMLLKTPFVTTVAVLSLALGIGANAAIFSLFDQILLRPLPVQEPQQLVNLALPGPMPGSTSCNQAGDCDVIFSYPMYRDLERQQTALAGIAGHRLFGVSLAVNNEPSTGEGVWVTGSYFPTLGLQPAAGRLLVPSDDEPGADHLVVVLSHGFWMERFGGSPDVLGQNLQINGRPFSIVGVAPEGFDGTTLGARPVVYVPVSSREWPPNFNGFENRRNYWMYVFGRLKPGVSLEAAKASLDGVVRPILADVEAPLQGGMSDATMQRFRAKEMVLEDGRRGQSGIHEEASTPLLMLFGITGVVLLIACANIANLLLARGAGRATEMGVRLALGANRRRLMTQLLTESVVLSLMGGIVSLVVASWTLKAIASLLPPEATAAFQFTLQPSVLVFAAALAVATGLVFGMFPALHSTRADLISAIRAGAGQIAGGRAAARFRAALVTVQIALSMALLISAGLFLKSLGNVSRVDLGVKVEDVVTFAVSPTRAGYDTVSAKVLYGRIVEELGAIPGVTAVTSSMVPLLAGNNWGNDVRVQGFQCGPDIDCNSRYNAIGADYFAALGVSLTAGRDFTRSDQMGGTRVAIVNQAFADKFGLGADAVGKYMGRGGFDGDSLPVQIVGLVPDPKYSSVKDDVPPVFYLPWMQENRVTQMYFYVRTSLPPEQLLGTIPPVMKRVDAALPLEELKTMPQQIKENVFMDRMISILSGAFAVLATLLAGVGLYGVLAYSVAQRTRELGVRMALGADAGKVQGLVLRQVGAMTVVGAVVGVAAAVGLGRAARSLLFGLEGHDPVVFTLAVVLLAVVAMTAGFLPARRASQVDPMNALRYD